MGISKLTTFMNSNQNLQKQLKLHSINVVIDGNSLYHFIFHHNAVDCLHGGDYYHYALKIREFFNILQSCFIRPYVVLDGGNEPDDKKLETTRRRMKYRQELVDKLAQNKKNKDSVVPILAFDTFKEVLNEIGIDLAVCDFEADREIGLLANELSYPVMSYDSDFFVLPLTAGFIHFDWVELTLQKSDTGSSYLPARIYYFNNFVKAFPSLGENVLPVLATLVGNDYIDTKIFKSFYDFIRELKLEQSDFSMPNSDNKIYKVIQWLEKSRKTVNEVMEICKEYGDEQSILSAFEITKKAFTFSKTENEKKRYSLFWGDESNTVGKLIQGFNAIPEWYVRRHRKGSLPPRLMDIITVHKRFLTPQMEDGQSQATSYQCSIKIRAYMYGILLSEDIQERRALAVEEYDYKDDFKTGRSVNPQDILKKCDTLPKLSEIINLPLPNKEEKLGMILDINSLRKFELTKDLELVMGIVLFWIKESNPKVTLFHLKSVIICMIMLKVKWVLFHSGATGCEKNLIETAALSLDDKDLNEISTKFDTYDAKPMHCKKNPVDRKLIHGFAQLQTCIMATMHLNSLLMYPFPSPCIPHIFSGTFLYNFCQNLSNQENPDDFMHGLLSKYPKLAEAYECLIKNVMEALGQEGKAEVKSYFNESWISKQLKRRAEAPPLTTSNKYECLSSSD